MTDFGIPEKGMSQADVSRALDELMESDASLDDGTMFGLIYHANEAVVDVAKEAMSKYLMHNGLSPMAFPSLLKMENELTAIVGALLHGKPGEVAGTTTSGGSESVLMAVKAAREWSREKKPDLKEPEIIIPVAAHPAWSKAAHLLGLKVVAVPVDEGFMADMDAVRNAVTDKTAMLVGSACTYPQGVIDPIEVMGAIAEEHGLWLHVDSCLGGMMLPWLEELEYDIPLFDFRVPGVCSITADLHKYGYAPKGVSTVNYRTRELRSYQFFAYTNWPGGIYGTPCIAGGRPGGTIASAWAVLKYLGRTGLMEQMKRAKDATDRLIAGIRAMPGFSILGDPKGTVFAFASDRHDNGALSGALNELGWHVEVQQLPTCLHMTVSPAHLETVDRFLVDLERAAKAVESSDGTHFSGSAVVYTMLATIPDEKEAERFVVQALSDIYTADQTIEE